MKKTKQFLLGTILGAVTGSMVAYVLAPCSGEKIKERLTEEGQYLKELGKIYLVKALEKSEEISEVLAQSTEEFSDFIQEKLMDDEELVIIEDENPREAMNVKEV